MSSLIWHSEEAVPFPPGYKYGTSASLERPFFLTMNTMADFTIHPLLSYSQYGTTTGHNQPTLWNICEPADCAAYPSDSTHPIARIHLDRPATDPPLSTVHVVCELFLGYWPITIRRPGSYVKVIDVLQEIHTVLIKRISQDEWDPLCPKKKAKITDAFIARCNNDEDPNLCRSNGVIRMDCLLDHTWFAGLSMSFDMDSTCILSLRRARQQSAF